MRGALLAVPVLLVFGGLLVSADAAFERIVTNAFDWNIDAESGISHFLGFLVAAWVALGLLSAPGAPHLARRPKNVAGNDERPSSDEKAPIEGVVVPSPSRAWKVGATEVGFVLGTLECTPLRG